MKNSVSFDNQNLVMPIENSFNQKQKRNVNPSQFDFTVGDFCFNLKDKIGSGKFSIVYKGYNITNGKRVGIKQMKQSQFQTPKMEQLLMNEIEVNRKLKSNHIVQMHDLIYQDIWIYMILELCPEGDLETYLEEAGGMLDEEESLDILTQILEGLKTLIYHGYIHRDMKPANIMKKGQTYKLADFGMATKVDTAGRDFIQEQVGSPLYMAPQILQNQKYTVKSDIWSIGLIFYQMLFGKTPWPARDIQSLISAIKEIPLRFPYDYPIGEQAKHFIKGCLQIEESDRFNWEQVFSHPIFNVNNKGHLEYGYKFDDKFKNIMRDLQQAAYLYQLFSRFDDLITFFESNHIFNQLKTLDFISQKEYVDSDELIRIFQEYDFVDLQDPASHILMDIKEIIKQNKYDIKSIFNVYLGQNAEKLNLTQFTKILHQFLPGLHDKEIEHCFEAFDNDNDGLISFQEFEYHLNFGITNSYKQKDKIKTKGMKIAEEIRTIIVEQNTTLKQLFFQFDHGNTRQLDFEQFKSFINYIKPEMHENDIKDLFQFFDERKTSHVSLGNLEKVINKNSSLQAKRKSIFIMH
ncbi:Protein kinase-like domain [Pseudocohnilembus persalinus]|uniref:Protein kinase-like domain n=1 Tax=Pseudocohnilembus persalinus TaxID=266149 RepID=A0A0V0QVH6_PSEPJ|nr:Protein kinase-like domain [Pseudocohnilembus persalinus]|eukprot:KRX06263.1 Protein kinase-like domain [Pseudocohnilembus persalinus]